MSEQAIIYGNAMHLNISLWDAKTDTNILPGGGGGGDAAAGSGLSVRGRAALAGLLHHVPALTAIMCPTVNSYKRLSHWPNFVHLVSWAVENRMALVRVPAGTADRLEVRLPDGATNPYLLPAGALAAMLSGLDGDMDLSSAQELAATPPPGSPQLAGFTSVPRSLPDALAALAADTRLAAYLPPALTGGYAYVRNNEWQAFLSAITQFELASLDDY